MPRLFGPTRDQGQNDIADGSGTDDAGRPFSSDLRQIDGNTEGNDGEYETEQTSADRLKTLKRESTLFIFSAVSGFCLPLVDNRLGGARNDELKLFQCVWSW